MPIYRIRRHVIYNSAEMQTKEVWGIDRPAPGLQIATGPRDTDKGDPLLEKECSLLLRLQNGEWVTWHRIWEWLSEAEVAGYELISGYKHLSPYSTLIIRGP